MAGQSHSYTVKETKQLAKTTELCETVVLLSERSGNDLTHMAGNWPHTFWISQVRMDSPLSQGLE